MMNKEMLNIISRCTQIDTKNDMERVLKLTEEVGELSQALLSSMDTQGCGYKGLTNDDVIEESIDVTIVALSVFCAHYKGNNPTGDFNKLIMKKLAKWMDKIGGEFDGIK